jgi:hypothetical protein
LICNLRVAVGALEEAIHNCERIRPNVQWASEKTTKIKRVVFAVAALR